MKKKPTFKIIAAVLAVVFVLVLVYFLYDSPAKCVKTENGSVYLNSEGEPVLYYTDLFGLTFYDNNGKREYAAVPAYIEEGVNTNASGTSSPDALK